MSIMLAALALAAPQDLQQYRVKASTEAEAARDFEISCMAGDLDGDSVRRAASASPRDYVAAPSDPQGYVRTWRSVYGTLQYIKPQKGKYSRCMMTAFTAGPLNKYELNRQLLAMLKRRLGSTRITAMEDGDQISWFWQDANGKRAQLLPFRMRKAPQQILLFVESVQP